MTDFSYLSAGSINTYCDAVQQMYNDSCAIKSQQMILNSMGKMKFAHGCLRNLFFICLLLKL